MKKLFLALAILFGIFINNTPVNASSSNDKAASLYKNKVKSVVAVKTQDSAGSGVILKEDGTFVTCFHVIANADFILVVLEDGSIYYVNGFKYINPLTDVAILTLNTTRKFTPINIEKNYKIGERVYTISNPQGLNFVFSNGIISQTTKDYIQFSAPISSGSSGGALLNNRGNLLGIITSQMVPSESQNINFALPSDYFTSKINSDTIINDEQLNWTEFLVAHANEEQFNVYAEYAINEENYPMLYKYMKPFAQRNDIPDNLYPIFGYMALLSYFTDKNEEDLNDALKYFELSYDKKQSEEGALFILTLLSELSQNPNKCQEYMLLLAKKYPNSYNKLLAITEMDSDESITEYFEYFNKLLGY